MAALYSYQGLMAVNTGRSAYSLGEGSYRVSQGDNWGYLEAAGGALGLGGSALTVALSPELNAIGRTAAKSATQLEFDFVNNLGNPKFVLYKASEFNPSMLRPGEYKLNLPWLRNEALDWAQNQQALQRAMNIGNPIREANPNALGGWLQRERDFMSSQFWQRTQQGSDVFWLKPSGQ